MTIKGTVNFVKRNWAKIGLGGALIVILYLAASSGCASFEAARDGDPVAEQQFNNELRTVTELLPWPFNGIAVMGGLITLHVAKSRKLKKSHLSTITGVGDLVSKGLLNIEDEKVRKTLSDAQDDNAKKLVSEFKTSKVGA
jgi:hypothetical protein